MSRDDPRKNPFYMALYRQEMAARAERANRIDWEKLSAEEFIEGPDFCDVPITPAQRAFIRAAEGLPVTHLDPLDLEYHLGTRGPFAPQKRPRIVVCRAGRRGGKSLLAVLLLIFHALKAQFRREPRPGERPERDGLVGPGHGERIRLAIAGSKVAQAVGTYILAVDKLQRSPKLARYVASTQTVRTILRRDDGREIQFEVLAAQPRGQNLRSGWFVGTVLDEADFFGEEGAVVNLKEQIEAVRPALVVGGQVILASSPWDEAGHFAKLHSRAFGSPTDVVAFHSSSLRMFPGAYDPEEVAQLRLEDPDFVSREIDAIPMAAGAGQFFPEALIIAACTRADPMKLPPNGAPHWAGSDPGLRKDSAALAIARSAGGRVELAFYEELIPPRKSVEEVYEDIKRGVPPGLSPSVVFRSFAKTALLYNCECVVGDQYYNDSAIEHMAEVSNERGDTVWYKTFQDNADSTALIFTQFKALLTSGRLILPRDPRIMNQLRAVRTRRGSNGKVHIALSRDDGSHADLLKAIVLACTQVPLDVDEQGEDTRRVAAGAGRRRW